MNVYVGIYRFICTYTCIYIYIYVCIHTYIYTHIYIDTCNAPSGPKARSHGERSTPKVMSTTPPRAATSRTVPPMDPVSRRHF